MAGDDLRLDSPQSLLTVAEALEKGKQALERDEVDSPRLTAEVLLSHVIGRERSFLFGHPEYQMASSEAARWREALQQRCEGKPTQYITGWQEFYGLEFRVTPDVLIPRPETELLVEEALARASEGSRLLDIGTGSGCIAVCIKENRPRCEVFAGDISEKALEIARGNARRLGAQVSFVQMDLAEAAAAEICDLVVCNPPYVPLKHLTGLQRELRYEPPRALFGGEDGLDGYRRLVPSASRVLRSGGWLLLELGYNTRFAVEALLPPADWEQPLVRADLAGIDRVLAARKR